MYADSTASRAIQHRAAMERHAHASRQAKIARTSASQTRKPAAQQAAHFRPWGVIALVRRTRPDAKPVLRPATV